MKKNKYFILVIILITIANCSLKKEYYVDFDKKVLTSKGKIYIKSIIITSLEENSSFSLEALHKISAVSLNKDSLLYNFKINDFKSRVNHLTLKPNSNYQLIISPQGDQVEEPIFIKTDQNGDFCCEGDFVEEIEEK